MTKHLTWKTRGDGYQWSLGSRYVVYQRTSGWVACYQEGGGGILASKLTSWQVARKVCEAHYNREKGG